MLMVKRYFANEEGLRECLPGYEGTVVRVRDYDALAAYATHKRWCVYWTGPSTIRAGDCDCGFKELRAADPVNGSQ